MTTLVVKVCNLTPSRRIVAKDFEVYPAMTCEHFKREVEEWLEEMKIDTGWIFYEEL
jgi:hypothetical protein